MTPSKVNHGRVIQYSPIPQGAYVKTYGGTSYGPATSALLDSVESWNLAYLSHNFDKKLDHPDPNFTTHVRRTIQANLDGTGPDMALGVKSPKLLGHMLRLLAPRFVYLIKKHKVLQALPLYQAYGQKWLDTIEERSWLCEVENDAAVSHYPDIQNFEQAQELIERIRQA